jgi:hypothetical protein
VNRTKNHLRRSVTGSAIIRDRIKEFRRVKASELRANPRNWRTHPSAQRAALEGVLTEIGYASALLARELPDGSLELVDGHLRAETTPDQEVPVLVLDIDEDEANKLLATLDPLAALALADGERLNDLLQSVKTSNSAVQAMLADLAKDAAWPTPDGQPKPADSEPMLFPERYEVLVQCADEPQQKELIERMLADGLVCRALIS